MTDSLSKKVNNLPNMPGVYLFKDVSRKVIYIGKAKNLKNRVGSYFHINSSQETKTGALVRRINDVDYVEVQSELDALILEADLIKKFRPKYNILQKDDKTYLFIIIRNEKIKIGTKFFTIPKVITTHQNQIQPKDKIFGPYPDGASAKYIIKALRKIFTYRDCSVNKFKTYQKKGKSCLYGQIGICSAPCIYYDKDSLEEYKKNIKNVENILKGKSTTVLKNLRRLMVYHSKIQEFEKAAKLRDVITKYAYVANQPTDPQSYVENPMLVYDRAQEAVKALAEALPFRIHNLERIECYDISNISGKDAVGSMVVSENGIIKKSEYKRFRIRKKTSPDDFEMLREVLRRRLYHLSHLSQEMGVKAWRDPDLLVIDGGAGQISAIKEVLDEYNLQIPLVGLAKRQETIIYIDESKNFVELVLDKTNAGLKHLVSLRDESHRFAQNYHHKIRSTTLFK